jgi:hypothetical protein
MKKQYVKKVAKKATEDEIRKLAESIYQTRIAKGKAGTAKDDWAEAEMQLS